MIVVPSGAFYAPYYLIKIIKMKHFFALNPEENQYHHEVIACKSLIELISSDKYKEMIEHIRLFRSYGCSECADTLEMQLPKFMPHLSRYSKDQSDNEYSDAIMLEVEGWNELDCFEKSILRYRINRKDEVKCSFENVRGDSLLVLVEVVCGKSLHGSTFDELVEEFMYVDINSRTKPLDFLCPISHDPEAYFTELTDPYIHTVFLEGRKFPKHVW
jgi:hypothetical protein